MAVFTTVPSFGVQSRRKPRVLSARFGDGYEQRGGDGINYDPQIWELTFDDRLNTVIDAVETFFVTNNSAVVPFDWTPPRAGAAGWYICRTWGRRINAFQTDTLVATFEQVFSAT